jgi:hypothetical protein
MPHRSLKTLGDYPFLDLASYGRWGPGRDQSLLPAQIEHIARTVRRTPEVMVKISGGGQSAKAMAAQFKYLSRRDFEIETDEGEQIKGKEDVTALVEDWELDLDAAESRSSYRGVSGPKPTKLVHNIVLSMPVGTPAAGVLEASRAFAREQFALKHRYALVLHTDQPHPHVHLVVKALSEQGKRINIRKETLREWRREFARHLRAQGIAATATARAVRGVAKPQKSDGIYRAMRAGRPTHLRGRVESVAAGLRAGDIRVEPGKTQIVETRRQVVQGWAGPAAAFRKDGMDLLANDVAHFVMGMPKPQTEREWLAQALLDRVRDRRQRESPALVR